MGVGPTEARPGYNLGAGEGNRTLVLSLEGFSSTIELHPQIHLHLPERAPRSRASAPKLLKFLVEGEGFEPSKAEPSDLQSDPFDRSGTPPNETGDYAANPMGRQLRN